MRAVPRVIINCQSCGETMVTTRARITSGKRFCSRKCLGKVTALLYWQSVREGKKPTPPRGKGLYRSERIVKICEACGLTFENPVAYDRRHNSKFCSRVCSGSRMRSVCEVCGKEYGVERWRPKSKQCSRACHFVAQTTRLGYWTGKKRPGLKLDHFWVSGPKHPYWKGGISRLNEESRHSYEYLRWKRAVIARDGKCVTCGSTDNLHADHIKSFRDHPELRFDLNNGRALCITCHRKTPTYGFHPKREGLCVK